MSEQPTEPINSLSEVIDELQKTNLEDLGTEKELNNVKILIKTIQRLTEGVRMGGIKTNKGYDPATTSADMERLVSVLENISEKWAKKIEDKPAVRKYSEKGADAFAKLDGLARFSNSHFVGDHLGAQLQKGTWEKNTQGQMALRKEYPNGGVSTALIRALDETDAMNEQLQQQVLERLGAFTADVTLAVIATMCDPRNKEFPLREPVLVTTDRILEYKKFQQRGERREEMERQVEQAMKDIQLSLIHISEPTRPY